MNDTYPQIENLSEAERAILEDINIDNLDIKFNAEAGQRGTWTDDNELCFNVIINNVKISFWWIDPEYFAACLYADASEEAARKVLVLIQDHLDGYAEMKQEGNIEDESL